MSGTIQRGFTLETLEPRVMLAGNGETEIIQVQWQGDMIWMRAGEWIVEVDPTPDGARDASRSRELPIESWLADAMLPLAESGITFRHYLGRANVFGIQAPVDIPIAQLEDALSQIPGFSNVGPNAVSGGSFGESANSNSAGDVAGDLVQIEWIDRSGREQLIWMRAGEWIVGVNATPEGARNVFRGRETPIEAWLADALAPLEHDGITFRHYLGKDRVFEIQAPTAMPFEELEVLLRTIPGFRTLAPNPVSGGSLGNASNPNSRGGDIADSGAGQAIFNGGAGFSGLFDQGGSTLAARASAPASLIAALRFSDTSIDLGDDEDADPALFSAESPAL